VRFELGEAAAPPFTAQSFDVVFSRHVLWTILDPAAAAKAWYHLLTPGGRVVVVDGIWPHRLVDHIAMLAGRVLSKLTRHQSQDDHAYPADLYKKLPMVKAGHSTRPVRSSSGRASWTSRPSLSSAARRTLRRT
jgi:SAM-dependent methyltransferase